MGELNIREILRSKEEKRILTGKISGIEDEYYKLKNEYISCAIVWYNSIKVLIPITHLVVGGKSKSIIRGMLGSEIDFIVIEYDNDSVLSAKDFEINPFKTIKKYIAINGEYTGKVIKFPKQNSGIIVQLDEIDVTCLIRVPARFNNYPNYLDRVLVKISEIKEEKKFIYGYLMRII